MDNPTHTKTLDMALKFAPECAARTSVNVNGVTWRVVMRRVHRRGGGWRLRLTNDYNARTDNHLFASKAEMRLFLAILGIA